MAVDEDGMVGIDDDGAGGGLEAGQTGGLIGADAGQQEVGQAEAGGHGADEVLDVITHNVVPLHRRAIPWNGVR